MRYLCWRIMLAFALVAGAAMAQGSDITASAIGQANLRAAASIESEKVGEIHAGQSYAVVGRSERFPWLLLADQSTSAPLGWVFETLVVVQGDLSRAPLSSVVVSSSVRATATPTASVVRLQPTAASATQSSPVDAFGVSGAVDGEVNIRYGPGIEYARLGVALAGQRFAVTGYHTQFPWLRIAFDSSPNGHGWIARDLLRVDGDVAITPAISQTRFDLPPLTATPSLTSAGLSADLKALADELWALMLASGFDPQTSRFGALYVKDLRSGDSFAFGADIAFSGTSINKIAILAAIYAKLNHPPSLELATDIANTMICSENVATNRLLSIVGDGNAYIGAEAVSAILAGFGATRSFITAPFTTAGTPEPPPKPIQFVETDADQQKASPDLTNQMTVPDIGELLAGIYDCAYRESGDLIAASAAGISPRECRQMLHVMSGNTVDALLKAGAPAETRVAHKHGWIADTHGNAAVFFTPGGDYVIVMMLRQPQWLNFQESLPLIAEVSRRVYNFFNPDAPMPEIREGYIPAAGECNYRGDPLPLDLAQAVWDT